MAELPIMPMYWDAYFGDTTHLTCLEHGAYLQIIGAMWRAGGDLPDDDLLLMRLTHLTRGQWKRIRPRIMGFMHPIAGGRFTQDKLLQTFNAVRQKHQSRSDSARARWLKKKGSPDAFVSRSHMRPNAIQSQISTTPFLVQSSLPREEKSGSAERQEPASPASFEVSDALKASPIMRKRA